MMGKRVVTLRSELFIGSITAKSYRVMMLYCFQEKHHVKKKKKKTRKYTILYIYNLNVIYGLITSVLDVELFSTSAHSILWVSIGVVFP